MWKSFNSFRGEAKISSWIYKVSLNTILSKRKKEQKQPDKESISSFHENKLISSCNSDDDLQFLKSLMWNLKDLDRAIIVLFLEGYKNKEISQILGLSTSNISTRMNRIKMKLKSKINI
ncbi:MAG: RNA polymerase sigma factor [Flammeovirgaceae bacterium]|nr:RNA polymerase sigma factor [Flammeovirgaceae bacterium]